MNASKVIISCNSGLKIFMLIDLTFATRVEGEGCNDISQNNNLQSSRFAIFSLSNLETKINTNVIIRYWIISQGCFCTCRIFLHASISAMHLPYRSTPLNVTFPLVKTTAWKQWRIHTTFNVALFEHYDSELYENYIFLTDFFVIFSKNPSQAALRYTVTEFRKPTHF